MLIGLGSFYQQEKYLQGRSERMTRILQEAAAVAAVMAAVSQQPGGAAVGGSSSSSAAAVPAGVESPEAWGFAANGTPPSLPRFVKALDERLINTMQETVMNVNGIFLQVCDETVMNVNGQKLRSYRLCSWMNARHAAAGVSVRSPSCDAQGLLCICCCISTWKKLRMRLHST